MPIIGALGKGGGVGTMSNKTQLAETGKPVFAGAGSMKAGPAKLLLSATTMTQSVVYDAGSTSNGGITSITMIGVNIPPNSLIIVVVADWSSNPSSISGTLSDGGFNTYTPKAVQNFAGASGQGFGQLFYAWNSAALGNATLTYTLLAGLQGGGLGQAAMSVFYVAGGSYFRPDSGLSWPFPGMFGSFTSDPFDGATIVLNSGTMTFPGTFSASTTSGTPAVAGELFVGGLMWAGAGGLGAAFTFGQDTTNGAWQSPPDDQQGEGHANVAGGSLINSGTGTLTYAPTLTYPGTATGYWASFIVSFQMPNPISSMSGYGVMPGAPTALVPTPLGVTTGNPSGLSFTFTTGIAVPAGSTVFVEVAEYTSPGRIPYAVSLSDGVTAGNYVLVGQAQSQEGINLTLFAGINVASLTNAAFTYKSYQNDFVMMSACYVPQTLAIDYAVTNAQSGGSTNSQFPTLPFVNIVGGLSGTDLIIAALWVNTYGPSFVSSFTQAAGWSSQFGVTASGAGADSGIAGGSIVGWGETTYAPTVTGGGTSGGVGDWTAIIAGFSSPSITFGGPNGLFTRWVISAAFAGAGLLNDNAETQIAGSMKASLPGSGYMTTAKATNGLIGWWNFANDDGTDFSGFNNKGILYAHTATFGAGQVGTAMITNGFANLDGISIPQSIAFTTFSLSCWVNLTNIAAINSSMFSRSGVLNTDGDFNCFVNSTGFRINMITSGVTSNLTSANTAPTLSTWYHCVFTFDGTTIITYVNGADLANHLTIIGTFDNNNDPCGIGFVGAGFSGAVAGQICDVRLYNRALSSTEVSSIYNSGLSNSFGNIPFLGAQLAEAAPTRFSGAGGLSVPGNTLAGVIASFAGSSSLTAKGQLAENLAVLLAGSGIMSATTGSKAALLVSLAGSGSLTAADRMALRAIETMAGAGSLSASMSVTMKLLAAFSGAGGLSALPQLAETATVGLSGAGNMSASGSSVLPMSVGFSGSGNLSAKAASALVTSAVFSGLGSLSSFDGMLLDISAAFAGVGSMSVIIGPPVPPIGGKVMLNLPFLVPIGRLRSF